MTPITYRGIEIRINPHTGTFQAEVASVNITKPSLAAMKVKKTLFLIAVAVISFYIAAPLLHRALFMLYNFISEKQVQL